MGSSEFEPHIGYPNSRITPQVLWLVAGLMGLKEAVGVTESTHKEHTHTLAYSRSRAVRKNETVWMLAGFS